MSSIDAPAPTDTPTVVSTVADLRRQVAVARAAGAAIGLVPTMGALHAGHASLIAAAKQRCGFVVVSVFVNPTQFGPHEDLARYPRTLAADLAACGAAGADCVFVPSVEEVYPSGCLTVVEVPALTDVLEGAVRPGHFRGVATVVLKLFLMALPDVAFFGAKDFQQQVVIRQMCRDLNVPVEIVTCPTVREPDGLALSSRNRYLSAAERMQAQSLSAALFAARTALRGGEQHIGSVTNQMRASVTAAGLQVDYAVVCDPHTLAELTTPQPEMALLIAARSGQTRLIDNVTVAL